MPLVTLLLRPFRHIYASVHVCLLRPARNLQAFVVMCLVGPLRYLDQDNAS